ncbi:unnamed protein product [Calypogeia fissa]
MEASLMAAKASIANNPIPVSALGSFSGSSLQKCSFLQVSPLGGREAGGGSRSRRLVLPVWASDSIPAKRVVPQSYASYAVPIENQSTSSITSRPLAEIFRDMNKRVPDKVLKIQLDEGVPVKYIPWYHANRMLSFYAPGWSGEVRNITFSADSRTVSVVYRVTIRGSDGEAWREASGTATLDDGNFGDPVQKAEGVAFRRACARFGLGLYLYHEDENA